MADVIALVPKAEPVHPCEDVVTMLRDLADRIEKGVMEYHPESAVIIFNAPLPNNQYATMVKHTPSLHDLTVIGMLQVAVHDFIGAGEA